LSTAAQISLKKSIMCGRNGKGVVHVFSAGNEYKVGENVNFEGWLNSIFTISVAATNRADSHSSFSSAGAPVFISAPGGEIGKPVSSPLFSPLFTTDANGQCKDAGAGTSYACPIVSGVVALILEANPKLTWRDVQEILASTAEKVLPNDSNWITNTGGYHHSILYGFGLIDAFAAVNAAKRWASSNSTFQAMIAAGWTGQQDIPDNDANGITINITIPPSQASAMASTEHVVLYISATHASRGDLSLTAVSPSGTRSNLIWSIP